MEATTVCTGLIRWLETFPGVTGVTQEGLSDGVVMGRVLNSIDASHFNSAWVSRLKEDCGDNWRLKVSNLRKIQQSVVEYLQYLNVQYADQTLPDLNKIGEKACPVELGRLLQLILGCAMNCHQKERHIESIMTMPAEVQAVVMNTLQTVFMRDASPGAEVAGPASFHPNQRTIAQQLEATTRARDEAMARVHELEMQLSEVSEDRKLLHEETSRLQERLGGLEEGAEGGSAGTVSRYKDLKKKIDSLQDDLFKVETSRDEYRSRVEQLERERSEIVQRSEELQRLADQAHTLQDEVDVLRDMGQRATQAETTIESYKKKLDELSDLRRQNKILEEKNADYMQHILELEEDVKKNDSWRPQLDIFKKQVVELRQQLAEETKKADRVSFENKKLAEKVEALTVEKDRVSFERDGLKEHLDELRCQRSAHSTDPRGDLPHGDLLATDPQEVWEKLIRLQHENQQLKKQQREGQSDPVLQAMVTDLQERNHTITAENRWADVASSRGEGASPGLYHRSSPHRLSCSSLRYGSSPSPPHDLHRPPSSTSPPLSLGSPASSSMAFLDAYISLDAPKKMKLLRKNLKWASESDLLILRQPSLFSNFFSSFPGKSFSSGGKTSSSSPPNGRTDEKALAIRNCFSSSKTPSSTLRRRPYSDGAQHIVIRHIHEFKMPPASSGPGSNEDSGCCRTSPSSCEGCEDGSGTLDSGVSGLYDCVSPVIPSIAEDCTTHHFSDVILPSHHNNGAIASSSSQQPSSLLSNCSTLSSASSCPTSANVMHHSHCCSPPSGVVNGVSTRPHCRSPSRHNRCNGEPSPSRASQSTCLSRSSHGGSSGSNVVSDSKTHSTSGISSSSSSPARRPIMRSPLPPDSPTPHNSPRIPTRVTATRNRSSRSSASPSHSSYSSMSESEPLQTPQHRRPYHFLQRSQSENKEDRSRPTLNQKVKVANRNCISSSNESIGRLKRSPTPEKGSRSNSRSFEQRNNAYNTKESLVSDGRTSNLIKCQASISADHIPVNKAEEIKICQSVNGLEISPRSTRGFFTNSHTKPVSVVRGVASAIRRPTPATNNTNSNDSLASNYSLSSQTTSNGSLSPTFEDNAVNSGNPNSVPTEAFKGNQSNFNIDQNEKQKITALTYKASPFATSSFENSIPVKITPECEVQVFNSKVNVTPCLSSGKPPLPSRGSFNLETHFGMHDISDDSEPVTVVKPSLKAGHKPHNHVTFKEPVVAGIKGDTPPNSSTFERKPTEIGASPFKRSASMRVGKPPTPKPKSDVTCQSSGTLFTHVVVSPKKPEGNNRPLETVPSPKRFQHYPMLRGASPAAMNPKIRPLIMPYMDSDSDEDVLEHRLVAGAYGAPLVSSESCTSVSHDDNNDTDPSATEYNTDNGSDTVYDFSPHIFNLNYDDFRKEQQLLLGQQSPKGQLKPSSSKLSIASLRRNSLSRIQEEDGALLTKPYPRVNSPVMCSATANKLKKHDKLMTSSLTGVKKKKKLKTARMVAAETFNAMFTFCTP